LPSRKEKRKIILLNWRQKLPPLCRKPADLKKHYLGVLFKFLDKPHAF
jgi:hypothetical protein